MILTAKEAKNKTCCNRNSGYSASDNETVYCCADECMAWRWVKKGTGYTRAIPDCPRCHGKGNYEGKFVDIDGTKEDVTYGCDCNRETKKEEIFGYCGLAGKTEGVK